MKLRLGSRWWNWRESSALTARDGGIDWEKSEIVVAKGLEEPDDLETEIHEMLHAIFPDMKERLVLKAGHQIAMGLLKLGWHRGR